MQPSNIIFDLAHVLFVPEFTDFEFNGVSFTPIEQGIHLLKRCAAQTDPLGNKHRLFVLSNLDRESLNNLQENFPDIFALFEGIIVSGMVNFKKPDARIFTHLLTTYNLTADNSIFIDDRIENVIAARQLGISGILWDNHHAVEKELKAFGVL